MIAKILVLCLVSFLGSTAHAQLTVALGGTLYQWRADSVTDEVQLEETRVTGCHQDGSLTLTRLTVTRTWGNYKVPTRSTVRVSNGDIFLHYGRESEPVLLMLLNVTRCGGEFGSPRVIAR